jgi:hypothetical protein
MQAVIDLIERVAGIACPHTGRGEECDCHVCEARHVLHLIRTGEICLSETCEAPISVSATLAHGEDSVTASVTAPADSDVHKLFDEVWRQVANNETS